jgi:esterase/lipase superfamily enzyme
MRKLVLTVLAVLTVLILAVVVMQLIRSQPTVYLMPTPAVISAGEFNPFDFDPGKQKNNEIQILYATNRIPVGSVENRTYTIFPGDKLGFGIAHMQIGGDETTWQQILNWSTSAEHENRPPLKLTKIQELVQYPLDGPGYSASSTRVLADVVNRALQQNIDKNITIYVHGAFTNIYQACAQAAQYRHFTGRNSLVLVFLWPSAENIFAYGTDTRHALKSAPAFARLVTLLAEHTNARQINVLAYSAGAQILSPALDIIGRNTLKDKRNELRIGEIYYAASDIGVGTFVRHLQSYIDIPRTITLGINRGDRVLALSARRNRESRVGRPSADDLNPVENQWIRKASFESGLSIIQVSAETVTGMSSRSHDFWYSHPWVSSDILTQFLFQKDPQQRGLVESTTSNNLRYWTFPPDYPERIIGIAKLAAKAK